MGCIVATCSTAILLQTCLGRIKGHLANEGWYGDGQPVLRWGGPMTEPRPHGPQGRLAVPRRYWTTLPAMGHPSINCIAENPAHTGGIPPRFPHRREQLRVTEPFGNAIERAGSLRIGIPGKDLGDHRGFDRIQPETARVPRTVRIQQIAIGGHRPRQQEPTADFGLAATAHAIGNQRPFILRNGATNL